MVHLAKFCKGDLWENKRFPFLSIFAKAFNLLKFIQILYEKEIVSIVFKYFFKEIFVSFGQSWTKIEE